VVALFPAGTFAGLTSLPRMYWPILMLTLLSYMGLTQVIKSAVAGEEMDLTLTAVRCESMEAATPRLALYQGRLQSCRNTSVAKGFSHWGFPEPAGAEAQTFSLILRHG